MFKTRTAARVAAQLEGPDVQVERIPGGFGELRVTVDGQDAYKSNRFLYPSAATILTAVKTWMAQVRS